MKRGVLLGMALLIAVVTCQPSVTLAAEGKTIAGVDLGIMVPTGTLGEAVSNGGTMAPFVGYMFNEYIGVMGQLHAWGAKTDDFGPQSNDNTTYVGGLAAGPRGAIPLGDVGELYVTFQPGIFTGLADHVVNNTSFGFSTGAGLNFNVTDNLALGIFGRWNRLYARVRAVSNDPINDPWDNERHDPKYVTTGVALTYSFAEAAPPPPPPPPPPPAPTPVMKKKVVPRAVYFDFDKSNIRSDARSTLDEAIRIIKEQGAPVVICQGHTDSRGTEPYNEKLSVRRAQAVKDYLVKGGVPASSIRIEGFGETRPVASNDTNDGRQQNRRVELQLMEK